MNADDRMPPGPRPGSPWTLRVYTASRDGVVTPERAPGTVSGVPLDVYGLSQSWPPCACPRHRGH